jgi:NAD(P)-dependent dehydrogenase (short-subunit alcohol dehydrogenase family)
MAGSMMGRRAVVVGASAGIGRAVGLRLAAQGAQVVFHGRRLDKLDEAVKQAGGGHAVAADLSEAGGCESLVATAADRLGGIDLLVHSASVSRLSLARDTPADEWARVYATNVIAPSMVVRAALPHFSVGALSVFISSESVGARYHGLIPYGSSKAALEEVVRGLRLEHPELRVGCIRVGQTLPTDFARDFSPALAADLVPIAPPRLT